MAEETEQLVHDMARAIYDTAPLSLGGGKLVPWEDCEDSERKWYFAAAQAAALVALPRIGEVVLGKADCGNTACPSCSVTRWHHSRLSTLETELRKGG